MFRNLVLASGLAFAASGAFAALDVPWINGLENTGSGFEAGAIDTRYSFTALSGTAVGTGGHGVVTTGSGFPFSAWIANEWDSSWLTPSANAAQSYDSATTGLYKWSISFDLTGHDPASAGFSGRWAADNNGYVVFNGNTISTGASYSSWTSFAATTGFVAGVNTIDFYVSNLAQNGGNPTGVRVEFLDSYASVAAPVPEPESYALILAGLIVVGAVAKRRLG
jgi:hypothetical protein